MKQQKSEYWESQSWFQVSANMVELQITDIALIPFEEE